MKSFWPGKSVLVTGGASFIGSHLVEKLVDAGAKVRVADDLSSGKLENLNKILEQIDFQKGDLRDRNFADTSAQDSEVVFHLAASHGGRGYIDTHPVECVTNMILDGTVFAAAHRAGVDRVVFASSACVYPVGLQTKPRDGKFVQLREDSVDPLSASGAASDGEYGWAKLMGEMALKAYHKQYGLKGVSCRIFTAYGERENETHAVIALIAKAFVKMDPYVIWGTGEQDRNFTYVADIADGLMLAAENAPDCSAINLGATEHIKIREVAEMIFDYIGFRPNKLEFDLDKPVGVYSRAADLTRTRELLNWEPQTEFSAGLRRTIDWYLATHDQQTVAARLDSLLTER
ncbi:MAG TPA: NAD-dependent epimerase/dehydratase family protein [Blastocatellia bacterium]|nr:NAD-dependent epimerase/dehydratase family protein [Blastocatellia bacterium]